MIWIKREPILPRTRTRSHIRTYGERRGSRTMTRIDEQALVRLTDDDLAFAAKLAAAGPRLDTRIHRNDAMFKFIAQHPNIPAPVPAYFQSGVDMLGQLLGVLERVHVALPDVASFLEFACGYGRFTRHLVRHLDSSRLVVSDVDRTAVDFERECHGVRGFYSCFEPEELEISESFKVVFVASLFSHLPAETWRRWLDKLYTTLGPGGVLVFSTHGPLCLPEDRRIPDSGLLYLDISETDSLPSRFYGTTYVTSEFVRNAVEEVTSGTLELELSQELWKYQDVFVVRRS